MTAAERLVQHQEHSGPLMEGLFAWMARQFDERRVEPNSVMGKAVNYALRRREGLTLWLREEGAPLGNNLAELVIQLVVLHRKNASSTNPRKARRLGTE